MKMEEWKECKLGEIATITKLAGFEFTKYIKYNETGEIIALRALNLRNGRLDLTEVKHIDKSVSDALPRSKLYKGEILFTYTGNGYGDCALVDEDDKYHLAPNICKISPNKKIADSNFLFQTIRSNAFYKQVSNYIGGSSQPTIPMETIRQLKVKLPPLPIQQKIAAILSSLDDKIELNNKINTNLEQQAQALFKNWFVDFEPFGGKMPERWKMGTIADFGDVVCGKTPSTKVKDYYGDKTPFITIPDMHNNVFACYTERYLSEKGELSQKGKTLPQNSVCVSCIATPGLVVMVDEPSQTNQQINSIIPKDNMSSCYVYLTMYYLADTIKMLGSSGSTTANLNKEQFSKIAVLIPTTKDLQNFDKLIKPIFENIKNNQHENKKLTSLRDTLLPKLMNGEINV